MDNSNNNNNNNNIIIIIIVIITKIVVIVVLKVMMIVVIMIIIIIIITIKIMGFFRKKSGAIRRPIEQKGLGYRVFSSGVEGLGLELWAFLEFNLVSLSQCRG